MNWEPWTGCSPYSSGCKQCYFYGPYAKRYSQNEVKKRINMIVKAGTTFWFQNTGSLFKKDGVIHKINPYKQTGMEKELGIDKLDGSWSNKS